jgi:hypothetical protein
MKKILLAGITLMLVSICFPAEATAQKFSKVVTDATRWEPVTVGATEECTSGPQECALEVLGDLNISVGDEPDFSVYRLGDVDGKNVTVVFVSHLIEAEDSPVLGELYRVELSHDDAEDKSFSLDALGKLYQCIDGPAGWRKAACE